MGANSPKRCSDHGPPQAIRSMGHLRDGRSMAFYGRRIRGPSMGCRIHGPSIGCRIHGPSMGRRIHGPSMGRRINGPSMGRLIYGPCTGRIRGRKRARLEIVRFMG